MYFILELLDVEMEGEEYYRCRGNRVGVEWKGEEIRGEQQKSGKLEVDLLRNNNMNVHF